MAEVEFHLHNEVGIKFPPLRPAYSEGGLYFGRFRELVARSTGTSIIGEGGTGRIHLVRDELMEREVALKIPLESILRDPAAREDVIRETRQAMELTHPNIVRIHDFHEGDGKWGISMQYVRGKNLDEWRYDSESTGFRRVIRPYTVEAVQDWIAQLCDALRYAHEDARMVHRDIKPKNLMLEKREGGERVYITDFGISQRLRQHTMMLSRDQTKAGESKGSMGTLPYMPWEQVIGTPASPLDDIYAVGATIYELITGRPPFYDGGFEQLKVQIREVPPPRMEQRILDLGLHLLPPPEEWEVAVAACLAKRPEDRPQSMRELAAALGLQSGYSTGVMPAMVAPFEPVVADQQERAEWARQTQQAQDELGRMEALVVAARQTEQVLAAKLAAAETERDLALKGGDQAIQEFQADAERRVAQAADQVARLQDEVAAARAAGENLASQAQQELADWVNQAELAQAEARRLETAAAAARQTEQELSAKLAATEAELVAALQGGDEAFRKFQDESKGRLKQADDRAAALQGQLVAAQKESEALTQQMQRRVAELEAKAQATARETEAVLQQAGDKAALALRKATEEAARALQQAKQEAKQQAEQAVQAAAEKHRRELDQATASSQQAATAAAQALQQAKQAAEQAAKTAAEKHRRELDQITERARKTEEEQQKALAMARDEAKKLLQKQAEELERTRQSVTKLTAQEDNLKRALDVEKERQGASLKPLLISLLGAVVLGLGGGYGWSVWRNPSTDGKLAFSEVEKKSIPDEGKVAEKPVSFSLFEQYAKALGKTAADLAVLEIKEGPNKGSVGNVNWRLAMSFCNWLTAKQELKDGYYFTLPKAVELESFKESRDQVEWSRTWAQDKVGEQIQMWGWSGEGFASIPIHHSETRPEFTFRIALTKNPEPGAGG